jgi:ketosteroid isomerase-like protein
MSQGNVEVIRGVYRAWSDGDLDAMLETLDPEIELQTSGSFPDLAPVYSGYAGIRAFWEAMRVPWEWLHLTPERIIEGPDRAAFVVRFQARGKDSGVITDLEQGHALHFRTGRVLRVSTHRSFKEALEAVGLSE